MSHHQESDEILTKPRRGSGSVSETELSRLSFLLPKGRYGFGPFSDRPPASKRPYRLGNSTRPTVVITRRMSKALNSNGVFLSFDLVRFRLHTPVFPFSFLFRFIILPPLLQIVRKNLPGLLTSLLVLSFHFGAEGRFFRFVL